jgi:hypothetical protein
MDLVHILQPSTAGLTLAAAAIIAGAPLFASGMRAVRLRKHLRRLQRFPLAELPGGFAHVHGRVVLESPLFAPLTATPCAGFQLEVRAEGLSLHRSVDERRAFRLEDGGASALVGAQRARWLVSATGERELRAEQPLTEGLAALLERVPEALWWRRAGGALMLVEHALPAGAECHVVGSIRPMAAAAASVEWARTGTDDAHAVAEHGAVPDPDLWVGNDDHLDFLLVSDQPPGEEDLRVPNRLAIGALVGPALSLGGMLYLASVADYLRSLGRF